ncbi:MAG: DUF488 family protein, N3 subclade [Actinomycetota bacterium]
MLDLTTAAYFADKKAILASGRLRIGVTAFNPRRLSYTLDATASFLAPSKSLLGSYREGAIDDDEFDRQYLAHLDEIGVDRIREHLELIAAKGKNDRLVLLCYEDVSKGLNCHRRTFAEWWEQQTGEAIPELASSAIQLTLS